VPGLKAARAAAAAAETTNAQLQALLALTDTALSHLALDDLLPELLGRVTAVMGVDHAALLLLDEDGQTLTVRAACGLLAAEVGRVRIPVGQGLAGRIAASQMPLVVGDTSRFDRFPVSPHLREPVRSMVGVPLLVEEPVGEPVEDHMVSQVVGVVHVGSAAPRRFTAADVQLLQRAADRMALAIGRARLYAAEQEARQRAETAQAQATERAECLRTILETIADGVAVYDADGRPLQVINRAYRELVAVERAPTAFEALSTFERARLLQVRDAATGAPLPFAENPVGRALGGETVSGPSADVRLRAFDGRELEVNASATPLRDGDGDGEGRVTGAVLVLRDMTERNRLAREREAARVQAERQAEQLDRIFETAADGLVVWDASGHMVRVNPAARRILGLDAAPPGFTQLSLAERFARYAMRDEQGRPLPPEEWPGVRTLRAGVATGVESRTETEAQVIRLRALDGREREVHDSTAPLRDREGRLVGAVCVMHDVTERNLLAREREAARADELAAREASRRMEAFLATAAHDLRTPLTATVGYLGLAERACDQLASAVGEASPALAHQVEVMRRRLKDADQSTVRLARLLTVLFDTAAIRAGQLELHRVPCDLTALVREQVAALQVAAPERTIRLHAPGEGDEPIGVEADADRVAEVITNYVTNALKYSPADQPVEVDMAASGSRARVVVRDAGPGLQSAERARVWELFHRAPGVVAQNGTPGGSSSGSLGLGLYICKAIVEAHSGRVGVTSAVGKGSAFWFTLPLSGSLVASRNGVAL
jgi:signal transduction histidine kinase/putative methionine-R-sulfoxide reductase with GAF domain